MDHESVTQTAIQAARSGQRVVLVTTPQLERAVRMRIDRAADRVTLMGGIAHFGSGWVQVFRERLHALGVDCDMRLIPES